MFVAGIDQLGEAVGSIGGDREVSDLVDNEKSRLPEGSQPLF